MLSKKQKALVEVASEQLSQADAESVRNGVSYHHLRFDSSREGEAVLSGNREGLIHLAKELLDLALRGKEGSHVHYDESGNLSTESVGALVVMLEDAEWDK